MHSEIGTFYLEYYINSCPIEGGVFRIWLDLQPHSVYLGVGHVFLINDEQYKLLKFVP